MTGREICTDAMVELGALAAGEPPDADDLDLVLNQLARLVDNWNADRPAIFADQFLTFTITPSLNPHTIGPTGATWTTSQRPVSIEGASMVTSAGTFYKIDVRSPAWYQDLATPELTSTIPTDLAYNPTWPNGSIYFYPVATVASEVQLLVRGILAPYTLATVFSMPPGYRDAMTLTLAEMCEGPIPGTLSAAKHLAATQARARIFTNNLVIPNLSSMPAGMPGSNGGWWDYQTGRYL